MNGHTFQLPKTLVGLGFTESSLTSRAIFGFWDLQKRLMNQKNPNLAHLSMRETNFSLGESLKGWLMVGSTDLFKHWMGRIGLEPSKVSADGKQVAGDIGRRRRKW